MLKSSIIITFIQILVYSISFASQLVLAKLFGASPQLDVYILAISIPHLFISITNSALSYSLVPEIVRERDQCELFREYLGALFWVFCVIAFLSIVIAVLITPIIAGRFLPSNLSIELREQYIFMSRLMWVAYGFSILASFFTAVNNSNKSFSVPAMLTSLPYLGMLAMALAFGTKLGSTALTYGMMFGYITSALFLFMCTKKEFDFPLSGWEVWIRIKGFFRKIPLVILSMFGISAYGVMDAIFVGRLGPNSLSEFTYAQRLLVALSNVILLGPMTVLLPYLSEVHANQDFVLFRKQTLRALRILVYFIAFLSLSLSALGFPIVRLLFERGAFSRNTTQVVATIIPWLSLGVGFMICSILLFRALYAKGEILAVTFIGSLGALLYFCLSFLLSKKFGINGILSAYAIVWIMQSILAVIIIWKESLCEFFCLQNCYFVIKLGLGLTFAEIGFRFADTLLGPSFVNKLTPLFRILSGGCILLVVYGAISILIFKMEEPLILIDRFIKPLVRNPENSDEG